MNRKDKKARKEAAPRPQVRPQPVRDDILAYLTKPRHAYEIAAHTGRRTATITGHMQAMLRLKLVERVAYGVYARAGTLDASPPPAALVRPRPGNASSPFSPSPGTSATSRRTSTGRGALSRLSSGP